MDVPGAICVCGGGEAAALPVGWDSSAGGEGPSSVRGCQARDMAGLRRLDAWIGIALTASSTGKAKSREFWLWPLTPSPITAAVRHLGRLSGIEVQAADEGIPINPPVPRRLGPQTPRAASRFVTLPMATSYTAG
jgi:hypothetical protein